MLLVSIKAVAVASSLAVVATRAGPATLVRDTDALVVVVAVAPTAEAP